MVVLQLKTTVNPCIFTVCYPWICIFTDFLFFLVPSNITSFCKTAIASMLKNNLQNYQTFLSSSHFPCVADDTKSPSAHPLDASMPTRLLMVNCRFCFPHQPISNLQTLGIEPSHKNAFIIPKGGNSSMDKENFFFFF